MPTLIIDEREIEVPDGTKVIDAAERLGIMIPRFCYHPALGSVGACRVCAVNVVEGSLKGIQMSCMLDAEEKMVVSTTDAEAVDFRRHVIEWLMLHHPHDCPVCDEGGHCLLQDMTVSGGHGIRRYAGSKRTYPDQNLGPLVQHEMNRCIHCYRCSRFYQDVSGYRDLGVMQLGNRTYFGRFAEGTLESPFAGNLSDICPTGVYTDKPSRYKGRRWDYERSRTLCIHCSLGCHTVTSARYREVVRQEARKSSRVNGWFICDRGRFGFPYASDAKRPAEGRIDGESVTWDESIRVAADRLARAARQQGPHTVAAVGSLRNSLETMVMLTRLSEDKRWGPTAFWTDGQAAGGAAAAVSRLEESLAVSLQEVAGADVVLVLGADPLNETPMLALALRQAWRQGAQILVADPRPIKLPFTVDHLPVHPADLSTAFEAVLKKTIDPGAVARCGSVSRKRFDAFQIPGDMSKDCKNWIDKAAKALAQCNRPVIVCGTERSGPNLASLSADAVLWLQAMGKTGGIFYVMPGPNAFGAVLMDPDTGSLDGLIRAVETDAIHTLVVVESDPAGSYPDRKRLQNALGRLDLLIVLDYVSSLTTELAHVFIPTATVFESGGCYLNQEGRLQASERAFSGGTPIVITGSGDHPPRQYGVGVPNGDLKPAWQTLASLTDREQLPDRAAVREKLWKWLSGTREAFSHLVPVDGIPEEGVRFCGAADPQLRFREPDSLQTNRDRTGFDLILTDWTFGTEELSLRSPHLQKVEKAPFLEINAEDAAELGLAHGDLVEISGEGGSVQLPVSVSEKTAQGVLVMPRHHRLDWQIFNTGAVQIPADRIRKL